MAAFVLVGLALWASLQFGLLPGLLAACAAYALTNRLTHARALAAVGARARLAASLVVGLVPLTALVLGSMTLASYASQAPAEIAALGTAVTKFVLQWREKLPAPLLEYVPRDAAAVQHWLMGLVKSQASGLRSLGGSALNATLMALVGLVCGILLANVTPRAPGGPLAANLRESARRLQSAFAQVVVAQVWIAGLNASLTAVLLYVLFPLFDVTFPHAGLLVGFTFVAGLVPVVGNLLCNAVLALVGATVSPAVGLAALTWLIAIHKLEYFVNAKVVGARIQTAAWELIAAIFVMEAVFGLAGLVAGPLAYAWLRLELRELRWA